MLLTLEGINKYFGDKDVLTDVNITLDEQDKIGIIGVNGAGKTTLVRIICGIYSADSGNVFISKGKKIGFLKQDSGLLSDNTIKAEMRRAFSKLLEAENRMKELRNKMGEATGDELKQISAEYSKISTYFEQQDGYNIDYKVKKVLNGMGFADKQMDTVISTLSGGEKTRLALAKLLLEQPDLLILDEPTNHLDFAAIEWLEEYLKEYKKAVLIVSHDRYFLDTVVNGIWEVEDTRVSSFKGNYSKYVVLKDEKVTRQLKEYHAQQEKIASIEEFVAKNLVRASTTKRAQSRQKELEKMEIIDKPKLHRKQAKLSFVPEKESSGEVLKVNNLLLSIDEKVLCDNVDFELKRGDKLGIFGVNGAGKSTLLKTINASIPIKSGEIIWGKNVVLGYYDQEHLSLNPNNSLLNEVWDRFPKLAEQQVRTALGAVGLIGEQVYKQVKVISGGEKAKLLFAILKLLQPNVMLLDEPTNHLDLETKEVLEKALVEYPGTIITVSHDRYFLNKIPNKIAYLGDNKFIIKTGNYDDYNKNTAIKTQESLVEIKKEISDTNKSEYKSKEQKREEALRRQRITELEKKMEELDKNIEGLELEMIDPNVFSDYQLMQDKCKALEEMKQLQENNLAELISLE